MRLKRSGRLARSDPAHLRAREGARRGELRQLDLGGGLRVRHGVEHGLPRGEAPLDLPRGEDVEAGHLVPGAGAMKRWTDR